MLLYTLEKKCRIQSCGEMDQITIYVNNDYELINLIG